MFIIPHIENFFVYNFSALKMESDNKQEDQEIVDFLKNSGYDEPLIRKALSMTKSRNMDDVVDLIMKLENEKIECKVKRVVKEDPKVNREEATRILEENKKTILADRRYREELIRRYQEDKKKNEEELKEDIPEEKVVEIKADCVFNIRFPDSNSLKLCFKKDDTLEDLFNKIEEFYGSSNFVLYKMRDNVPINRSTEKLQNVKKIYPKAALYIE